MERRRQKHGYELLLLVLVCSPFPSASGDAANSTSCPFNLTALEKFLPATPNSDQKTRCLFAVSAIHLLQSDLLLRTSRFLVRLESAPSCWSGLASRLQFDPHSDCGYPSDAVSRGCMNISTRGEFESRINASALADLRARCNRSLDSGSPCASCTTFLASIKATYLPGPDAPNNVSDCNSYPAVYTAAAVNPLGPSDPGTADCLFFLTKNASSSSSSPAAWIYALAAAAAAAAALALAAGAWCFIRKRRGARRAGNADLTRMMAIPPTPASAAANAVRPAEALAIASGAGLARYSLEEIHEATGGFSTANLIGKGGYGNVYRGTMPDGAEVAVKRFKNLAAAGDASFAHEVEVIASVRHVNLVALRGYCVSPMGADGHQRMLVCELVRNGSLHDHLFGGRERKENLSWPVRKRVALGTARGLAYLHHGAQPKIIHRDVKASNVLLDDDFEPKLADFGLAKFAPEGLSHLSTRAAGTLGYVAPEYALYGKLTEKSDVYSFGVLLLELFSGRRAVVTSHDARPWLLTDWAWSLVKDNRTADVVEDGMLELEPAEVIEKFVLVAVLCSHPHLHARPSMEQVVKMLEKETAVPPIPDRPISIIADIEDIERSLGSSSSGQLTGLSAYQPSAIFSDAPKSNG